MQIQFHHMSTQTQASCQDCKLLKFSSNCVVDIVFELSNDVIFAFSKSACLVELTTHAFSVCEQRVISQHSIETQRVGVDKYGSGCVDSVTIFVKYFVGVLGLSIVTLVCKKNGTCVKKWHLLQKNVTREWSKVSQE